MNFVVRTLYLLFPFARGILELLIILLDGARAGARGAEHIVDAKVEDG